MINIGIASTNIDINARAAKAAKHWQNQPMCHFKIVSLTKLICVLELGALE